MSGKRCVCTNISKLKSLGFKFYPSDRSSRADWRNKGVCVSQTSGIVSVRNGNENLEVFASMVKAGIIEFTKKTFTVQMEEDEYARWLEGKEKNNDN